MLLESKTFWLITFYLFWAACVAFVVVLYRWVNRKPFRSSDVESTEVGYEEDPSGHLLARTSDPDIVAGFEDGTPMAHFNPAGPTGMDKMGSM